MLAFIFFICLSAQTYVVHANPLYQTYAQPCPWQQNPWPSPDMIFEAASINPYAVIPQNPSPTCQPSNNQDYVSRILSNPSIRTLLDPKTKIYDKNGFEIPKNIPGNCPNVINNYIIIPPEAFIGQQSNKPDHGERNKNNRGRNQKPSKNNNFIENPKPHNIEFVNSVPINSNGKFNDGGRRMKPEVAVKNDLDHVSQKNTTKVANVVPKDNGNVIRLKIIKKNPREEAVIQEFKRKFPGVPEEVVVKLLAYIKRKLKNGELVLDKSAPNIKSKVTAVNYNSKSNSRNRNGHRRRKEPKNERKKQTCEKNCEHNIETIIHPSEYIEQNDVIENDTANKTLETENGEVNSRQFEQVVKMPKALTDNVDIMENKTFNTIPEHNVEFVDIDLIPLNVNQGLPEHVKSQEEVIGKPSHITINENEEELDTKIIGPKEETKKQLDQIYKPDTDGHKLDYNYNVENTRLPELGTEDEVPITVNGIYEDYYPDFRNENQYALSYEEYTLPNLHSDRYDNTADRVFEMEELSRERRKYEQNYDKNHHTKFFVGEKKTDEIENHKEKVLDESDGSVPASLSVKKESETMTFKAPPALEIPDFETKNVREFKSYYEEASKYEPMFKNSDALDKTSVYSDKKNQKYEKVKPDWKKEKRGDLETVSAPSKVVKYGQNSDNSAKVADEENERYSTVVIAESYPDYEW